MNSSSVSGKNWILKKFDENDISYFKENFYLDEITSKLLAVRNLDKNEIQNYLNPTIKNILPNPDVLKDMSKTVERTYQAILKKEKIGIFGDYDVDGATSTALLGQFFQKINHNFEIYIPDRRTEGYGPTINGFKNLIDKKVNLIFTVDCGTMSYEPIEYAQNKNIDVLIFDHHQSEFRLPACHPVMPARRLHFWMAPAHGDWLMKPGPAHRHWRGEAGCWLPGDPGNASPRCCCGKCGPPVRSANPSARTWL